MIRKQSYLAKCALIHQDTFNMYARTYTTKNVVLVLDYAFRYLPQVVLVHNHNMRWVKQALLDHLSMSWNSPYLKYISEVRREMGIFSLPQNPSKLNGLLNSFFITQTNDALAAMSLPWLKPISKYRKTRYVREGERSEFVACFRFSLN